MVNLPTTNPSRRQLIDTSIWQHDNLV